MKLKLTHRLGAPSTPKGPETPRTLSHSPAAGAAGRPPAWVGVPAALDSFLARDAAYLLPKRRNKNEELVYRTDVVASRAFQLLTNAAAASTLSTPVLPGLGAAFELLYVVLLVRHAELRPRDVFQKMLIGTEAVRSAIGLGTAGVLIATAAGVALPPVGLGLATAALGLGVVKGLLELGQKGHRFGSARRAMAAARAFEVSPDASPEIRAVIRRAQEAFLVKSRRLRTKTVAYSLMVAGQALALIGLFTTGWPLIIGGVVLALAGGAARMVSTVRDAGIERRQHRAVATLHALQDVGEILNRDLEVERRTPEEAAQLRDVFLACAKRLPRKPRAHIRGMIAGGDDEREIVEALLQQAFGALGVEYDPSTGQSHWDPMLAPNRFALDLLRILEGGAEADVAELKRFFGSFIDPELLSPEKLDRDALLEKLTVCLPRGRQVLQQIKVAARAVRS